MSVDLRKPTEDDLARFKECLAADPDHGQQDADAWTAAPGEFMVFFSEKGERVFVRIERVLRVSLQDDPELPLKARVSLLYKTFCWLAGSARNNGFAEVVFESRAPRLIQFLQKLFGVKPLKENFHLRT
jgi:hypothetical protein